MEFEGKSSTRNPAVTKLMKEACELREATDQFYAHPLEEDLFEWRFTIKGASGSEFENGFYHGKMLFPTEYPTKPPTLILTTPNGRFEINKPINLSISGQHPETWTSSCSIRIVLLALIEFMPTQGNDAIDYSADERKLLADKSLIWECQSCGKISEQLDKVQVVNITTDESKLIKNVIFKQEDSDDQITLGYTEGVESSYFQIPISKETSNEADVRHKQLARPSVSDNNTLTKEVLQTVKDQIKQSSKPEDRFNVFGKIVALKLRELNIDQRRWAEKYMNDILFEADCGNLDGNYTFVRKVPPQYQSLPPIPFTPQQFDASNPAAPLSSTFSSTPIPTKSSNTAPPNSQQNKKEGSSSNEQQQTGNVTFSTYYIPPYNEFS